jgi:hypothetical protein
MSDALNRAGADRRRGGYAMAMRASSVAELEERHAREQSESRVGGENAQARPRADRQLVQPHRVLDGEAGLHRPIALEAVRPARIGHELGDDREG